MLSTKCTHLLPNSLLEQETRTEQTGAYHLTVEKMGAKTKRKRSNKALRTHKILFQRPWEQNK